MMKPTPLKKWKSEFDDLLKRDLAAFDEHERTHQKIVASDDCEDKEPKKTNGNGKTGKNPEFIPHVV